MASTVEDSNEKHLTPWSEACERDGIHTTPLSPYLDQVGSCVGWRKSAKINGIFTITATVLAHSIERLTTELAVGASISGTGPKIRKIK